MRPARILFRSCSFLLIFAALSRAGDTAAAPRWNGDFRGLPEPQVAPSPDSGTRMKLDPGDKVIDLDGDPRGRRAAVLFESQGGRQTIRMWDYAASRLDPAWPAPPGLHLQSLAWHPLGTGLFLMGRQGAKSVILAWDPAAPGNPPRPIYATGQTLRRLVAGPRPFAGGNWFDRTETIRYRLFFGVKDSAGGYSIRSVTEHGGEPYQVVGKAAGLTPGEEDYSAPSKLVSPSALPLGFHPAGHLLIWQDSAGCFEWTEYMKGWGSESRPIPGKPCGGTLTATPNGLGLLHWRPGTDGVEWLGRKGVYQGFLARGSRFAFTPSSTPDGKGLLGWLAAEGALAYVPVQVPLADVINAWMFVETPEDARSLVSTGAEFRKTDFAQMYELYDTESYGCGGWDRNTAARPYLVTTDVFWEVYAAAYEGLFTLAERKTALGAFWEFVAAAADHYRKRAPGSYWDGVFHVLAAFHGGRADAGGEVQRIREARGKTVSKVLGREVDYGELKPRGHYASDPAFADYFKGFMYLTRLAGDTGASGARSAELRAAPAEVKQKALAWIGAYRPYIAPARSPLVWDAGLGMRAATGGPAHPSLFPLSWGMDNEILNSTVYHKDWSSARQIIGPNGAKRLLASGIDLPAAAGDSLALAALAGDRAAYPNLDKVLRELRARPWPPEDDTANLYDRWMGALRTQWAEAPALPSARADWRAWPAKRLQTGLASWATLRHATVLVNETTGAECGEGGFEELVLRPPRGYVEPDPATFSAMARLFEATAGKLPAPPKGESEADAALRKGLSERLRASAEAARQMETMARKELRGQALADSEYDLIQGIGGVAEHHFLLYKSIGSEGHGLVRPDPIPKIIDVAGGSGAYLFAAVGHPLEWDQVVPYYGRREMVKGAIYSYYEFAGSRLYDDKEWQAELGKRTRPDWIRPYVTDRSLACPPQSPY